MCILAASWLWVSPNLARSLATTNCIESVLGNRGLAVPFAYAVARTDKGAPVVVAGTDMERVRNAALIDRRPPYARLAAKAYATPDAVAR